MCSLHWSHNQKHKENDKTESTVMMGSDQFKLMLAFSGICVMHTYPKSETSPVLAGQRRSVHCAANKKNDKSLNV